MAHSLGNPPTTPAGLEPSAPAADNPHLMKKPYMDTADGAHQTDEVPHPTSAHPSNRRLGDNVSNVELNEKRENGCFGITHERKYFRDRGAFVKRSLRAHEWQTNPRTGTVHVPKQGRERLLNEAASLDFLKEHTNIPVPTLHCAFEDDGAVHLVMEYVEGTGMDQLNKEQREVVEKELDLHLRTLRSLRSRTIGGPSGLVVPPYRLTLKSARESWHLRPSDSQDLVFCHNDLSQQNIIVDPDTLNIQAIVDWEYAGFYPEFFERRFFERIGPSVALDGEEDDTERLLNFYNSRLV
ncbi:MAG: hypothetical protein M1817_001372 [Caeruleum heppii]|nr:MAG: hypothetical protein M1817_001372 [Caeruleum heppii]